MPTESLTNFEKFWLEGMKSTDVLHHLHFQKSSAASSSGKGGAASSSEADNKLAKVRNQIQNMQTEMQGAEKKTWKGPGPKRLARQFL